ncbi:MAG: DUF983 domain-containing protein [Alphaproteobacteria bacterium]|jgi:uncharacterized protein (DUF983 family)
MTNDHDDAALRPRFGAAVRRALRGRCPNCGEGRLMRAYLKPVERCAVCAERFGHIRADDAGPWLTILLVGHLVVPAALLVEQNTQWPAWLAMTVWPLAALALSLLVLPRAKTLFIGIIWSTGAPGSELT